MSNCKTHYTRHFLFLNNPIKSWIDAVVKFDTTRLLRIPRKNTTRSKKNGQIIFLKRKCKTKQTRIHTITGRSRRRSESLSVANLEKSHNEETQNRKSERSNRVHFPIEEYEKALQKMGNYGKWKEMSREFCKTGYDRNPERVFFRRCRKFRRV